MNVEPALQELLDVAAVILPTADLSGATVARGQFHDVVLVTGVAAVRVARRPQAARELPRRTALLRRLAGLGLPFAVPEPLTDVQQVGGRVAVATEWIAGARLPEGEGNAASMAALLAALRDVRLDDVVDLLDRPHAYAGGDGWHDLMLAEAVPRLPFRLRDEARRRVEEAAALSDVAPCLVHGDLGGENLHWDGQGRLVGVLDWDFAQPFDQAVDAACLGQQGWNNLRAAVDAETFRRAQTWSRIFPIEQIAAALTNEEPEHVIDSFVRAAARRLTHP